jgi:hypothetical protein
MEYKDGVPNHAMVLRGFHVEGGSAKVKAPDGKAVRRASGSTKTRHDDGGRMRATQRTL